MFTAFTIVCAIVFLFLFLIWKSNDWLNIFLRALFAAMLTWSIISALIQFGFHR